MKIFMENNLFYRDIEKLILMIKGKKVVFTNGCFDLLHYGHIALLNYSKKLGDVLVVGLNSDKSVKSIKGNSRPIYNENMRAEMLLSLKSVDYVIIFDTDTPVKLIEKIKPSILVKGSDYKREEIVGAETVKKYNGEIVIFDRISNISTSNIIQTIKNTENTHD